MLDTLYTKIYYEEHEFYRKTYMALAKMFYEELKPESVLDVGCGAGYMMEYFSHIIPTHGVDGSTKAKEISNVSNMIDVKDLRIPFDLGKTWDLAISIEVAEHIEPEFADIYLDNIIKHADRVLLTTAKIGQGGRNHVNCQNKQYWIDKMSLKGYEFKPEITEKIRTSAYEIITEKACPILYLVDNFSYYERGKK